MVMSLEPNPACREYCEILKRQYAGAVPLAAGLIIRYQKTLFEGKELPEVFGRTFGAEKTGSRSICRQCGRESGDTEMKFKLTSLEKKWVLYDVGNSAFTMMVSTIFPIYFNSLAESAGISDVNYLAYWGYATSVCTLIVALLGPTLGAVADTKNFKKIVFSVAMGVGVFGCILLGFPVVLALVPRDLCPGEDRLFGQPDLL